MDSTVDLPPGTSPAAPLWLLLLCTVPRAVAKESAPPDEALLAAVVAAAESVVEWRVVEWQLMLVFVPAVAPGCAATAVLVRGLVATAGLWRINGCSAGLIMAEDVAKPGSELRHINNVNIE